MKLIDRYIFKQFVTTILFSLFALYTIFLVVNLIENLDDFIAANMPNKTIIKYYLLFFPEIIKLLLPISVLLSTLFTIGKMSNNNEITALKSGGISIYRLLLPILCIAISISIFSTYFNGYVVPKVNKDKLEIEAEYLKKNLKAKSLYNLYFKDKNNLVLSLQTFNTEQNKGYNASIEKFSSQTHPRLIERIEGEVLSWDKKKKSWKVLNGVKRVVIEDSPYSKDYKKNTLNVSRFDTLFVPLSFNEKQLQSLAFNPQEMNFSEYKEYIQALKSNGKDVRRDLTDYYGQWAYPFASLIIVLFAVPFAATKKKGGTAIQIASALVITFIYLIFTKVGQVIGYNSNFNPIIAGWFANIVFIFFSIIVLIKTKS